MANLVDKKTVKLSDVLIEDYLQNKSKTNNRTVGECKLCKKEIPWNRDKLASHKRANCLASEKGFWHGKEAITL